MDNDYELLYLAKEDLELVWDILYKKYKNLLYFKALKYSTSKSSLEDFITEAELSFYDAIESYQDNYSFITYLNSCLERHLQNYKKSINRKKHRILTDAISINNEELEININDKRYNPEEILLKESNYQELKEKIINNLSWKEELIFILKEQNYTNKEIAEITDNNLRTIYNIINRIKNRLKKLV